MWLREILECEMIGGGDKKKKKKTKLSLFFKWLEPDPQGTPGSEAAPN